MYLMIIKLITWEITDTVALQSRKNRYSLFVASWLSWKCAMPKLGWKKKVQTILNSSILTLIVRYELCCVYSAFRNRSAELRCFLWKRKPSLNMSNQQRWNYVSQSLMYFGHFDSSKKVKSSVAKLQVHLSKIWKIVRGSSLKYVKFKIKLTNIQGNYEHISLYICIVEWWKILLIGHN